MGYGVISLNVSKKVIGSLFVLTVAYLSMSYIFEINIQENSESIPLAVQVAVATIDATFMSWIAVSLMKTKNTLESEQQTIKLQMFQSLTRVVIAFMTTWIIFGALYASVVSEIIYMRWARWWILFGMWQLLSWLLLAIIAWIWRPGSVSVAFAMATQVPNDDGLEMHTGHDPEIEQERRTRTRIEREDSRTSADDLLQEDQEVCV